MEHVLAKEIMRRRASDNQYLHKDFHGALNVSLDYLLEHYGEESVREYLHDFARSYYAPLSEDVRSRGLIALKEHFEKVYSAEGGRVEICLTDDELTLNVDACPAVAHLHERGFTVSKSFLETSRTVNAAICEDTEFTAELLEYDLLTGRSIQRFYRRVL